MLERNIDVDTDFHTFKICGAWWKEKTFPGLNDLLHEAERHPMAYNRAKKQYETIAINAIRVGLGKWKPKGVVVPHYFFCEPKKGMKRDYDNIAAAGRKIINDALVKSGYLKDDSPTYLEYGDNTFVYDDVPYIKVYLEDLGEKEDAEKE